VFGTVRVTETCSVPVYTNQNVNGVCKFDQEEVVDGSFEYNFNTTLDCGTSVDIKVWLHNPQNCNDPKDPPDTGYKFGCTECGLQGES